jgi:flavin reductase (DIM6/NTAB) family NADH-FMN oxidoreductase RutF
MMSVKPVPLQPWSEMSPPDLSPDVLPPDVVKASAFTMMGLRPIPVAVTTAHGGRANGLITLSGGPASVVAEAPRVMVGITKYNFSHDLIADSGVFAIHVLSNAPELVDASIEIIRALGGRSGRDGDKLGGLRTRQGVTGAPILLDSLTYVEARITGSLDNQENTVFVGDVVAAERLNAGSRLDIGDAWGRLGTEWTEEYERNHEDQVDHCRLMRGLPIPERA